MTVTAEIKPMDKLKKIRSLDEVLTRGGQAISAFREQRSGGSRVPTDEEFFRLFDPSHFGRTPIIAETIWQKFYANGAEHFFRSFTDPEDSVRSFGQRFGDAATANVIAQAESIVDGRIDLMGLKSVFVGRDVDWHLEPLSSKRSPLKHWKQFDDLEVSETGDKKIVWELNRHQHFFTLGFAYWLTRDEKFADTFCRHLGSWIEENPPGLGINWASSLEVSFRAISWLWAFHFFKESDLFTPGLFLRAMKHLYLHGRHIEKYLSTYYSPNTHLTGEALGLYYLGTQLPFIERSAQWRNLGEEILIGEIGKQIHPDGVYFEQSTWYQRYTADFFSHFVVLRSLWGSDRSGPSPGELESRLETAMDFLMYVTLPDGQTPLIGDDDGGRMLPLTGAQASDFRGTLGVGAVLFDRGEYKFASGGPSEELFWLMGPGALNFYDSMDPVVPARESLAFEQGGYSVMRDGWSETDNCLIIDCGEIGSLAGGHGHADSLAIVASMHGRPFLVDSGTFTYHESKELRDYFRSTAAHNTLTIDGLPSSEPGNSFSWQTRAKCTQRSWIASPRFDFFEGEHDGYARLDDPAIHRRSVLFLKGDYWIVRDLAETGGEHDYSLNFHFDENVRTAIGPDGAWVGGDDHRIFTFGDNGRWERKESWISRNHGNRMNAPFMRFVSHGVGPQEFFTFIMPVDKGVSAPEVIETPMIGGRAFLIRYGAYTDLFVVNDDPGSLVDTGVFESDFRYSWARIGNEGGIPDEFVLIEGTRLTIQENHAIAGGSVDHASGRRLGNDLNLRVGTEARTFPLRFVDRRKRDRRQKDSDRRRSRQ